MMACCVVADICMAIVPWLIAFPSQGGGAVYANSNSAAVSITACSFVQNMAPSVSAQACWVGRGPHTHAVAMTAHDMCHNWWCVRGQVNWSALQGEGGAVYTNGPLTVSMTSFSMNLAASVGSTALATSGVGVVHVRLHDGLWHAHSCRWHDGMLCGG